MYLYIFVKGYCDILRSLNKMHSEILLFLLHTICLTFSSFLFCFISRSTAMVMSRWSVNYLPTSRRMAENGFAPRPLGNFADISYLVEN